MQLRAQKYLFDIQQACDLLSRFLAGKQLKDYEADAMLRSAVERQFEIVGEAIGQMLKLEPALAARITEAKRIVAFRNLLIHGYWSIANDVVWGIIEADLPVLRSQIDALARELTVGDGTSGDAHSKSDQSSSK